MSWWRLDTQVNRAISEHAAKIYEIEKSIQELEHRLEARLAKLEKIERIASNVARERAQRPKNWTQFRTLAEGIEEPNAQRRQG